MIKTYILAGIIATSLIAGGTAYAAEDLRSFKGMGRGDNGSIIAELLGITQEEFKARVTNGEKPKDMLEAAGITKEDIASARMMHMKERLAKKVADGKITQSEADARLLEMEQHKAKHEAIKMAISNNDYAAFASAVSGTPMAEKVDAETFAKLVEAHRLHESGDHEGARAILKDLGLGGFHMKGNHGKAKR